MHSHQISESECQRHLSGFGRLLGLQGCVPNYSAWQHLTGCRGSHRQVDSWRHPHGSIHSLPIWLLLQLWEKGRMPGIIFEELLPKKKGWEKSPGKAPSLFHFFSGRNGARVSSVAKRKQPLPLLSIQDT